MSCLFEYAGKTLADPDSLRRFGYQVQVYPGKLHPPTEVNILASEEVLIEASRGLEDRAPDADPRPARVGQEAVKVPEPLVRVCAPTQPDPPRVERLAIAAPADEVVSRHR